MNTRDAMKRKSQVVQGCKAPIRALWWMTGNACSYLWLYHTFNHQQWADASWLVVPFGPHRQDARGATFTGQRAASVWASWYSIDPDIGFSRRNTETLMDAFIPINANRDAQLPSRIVEVVAMYSCHIDGMVTFFETCTPLMAQAAQRLGLPTDPPQAFQTACDKYRTSVAAGHIAHRVGQTLTKCSR